MSMDCDAHNCSNCPFEHTCIHSSKKRWSIGYMYLFEAGVFKGDECVWSVPEGSYPMITPTDNVPLQAFGHIIQHISANVVIPMLNNDSYKFGSEFDTVRDDLVSSISELTTYLNEQGDARCALKIHDFYKSEPNDEEKSGKLYWTKCSFERVSDLMSFSTFTCNGKFLEDIIM